MAFFTAALTAMGAFSFFLYFLYFFQLGGYSVRRYIKVIRAAEFKAAFFMGVAYAFAFLLGEKGIVLRACLCFCCVVLGIYFIKKERKVKFVLTARAIRLMLCGFAFAFVIALYLAPLALIMACFLPIAACAVLYPYEKLMARRYISQARELYSRVPVRICVTGSYAKTTVKNMCATLLSQAYETAASPSSYNTPLGLCLAAKQLSGGERIAVIEMGARKKGDIKELCGIAPPSVSILTGIAAQHLETFGSLDAIENEKLEVYHALKDKNAFIYNADDQALCMALKKRGIEGLSCGFNGKYVKAESLGQGKYSFAFGGEKIELEPKLLGRHSITDLCLAIGAARLMRVPTDKIVGGIEAVKPVAHRLSYEVRQGITIIDDSYNCNIKGAQAACEVLKEFKGRAFVVTAGIVEGGKENKKLNERLGEMLSDSAYRVYTVGVNSSYIRAGLVKGGFSMQSICKAESPQEAAAKASKDLKEGDVVLFMNDLPDNCI